MQFIRCGVVQDVPQVSSLKSQVVLLQTAHYCANAGDLLGAPYASGAG